jgi:hypothetical protein
MDFIERWLHISPDGGNGTFELLILLVPVLIVVAVHRLRRREDRVQRRRARRF